MWEVGLVDAAEMARQIPKTAAIWEGLAAAEVQEAPWETFSSSVPQYALSALSAIICWPVGESEASEDPPAAEARQTDT